MVDSGGASARAQHQPSQHAQPWNDPAAIPHVRLKNVVKRFGDFTAIHSLSLDIYRGEFFALLGPSGCGKTTLLRMLAGFEQPSEGQILLEGEDVSTVPPFLRPVNMMFQSYALFPHMSVEQNIAFGLKQERVPKPEIKKRVDEVVEMTQLGPFVKRKPHQLSGGQRQRVALARSIVKRPKMLLLDEPLGALDKKLREQTQFELVNIQEELGMTFVIVTHDQEEAMTVATRIAVMDHGHIVQVAPPVEIYETPASRYVADFIGDINLISARIVEIGSDHTDLRTLDETTTIRVNRVFDCAIGTPVWAALRPEKLTISTSAPQEASVNTLQGVVWDIGYLGNRSIYHVKLADGQLVTCAQTNRYRQTEQAITWHDTVTLQWHPSAVVVLFD